MRNSTPILNDQSIKAIFESNILNRRDTANNKKCSIDNLKSVVDKWQNEGSIVVFTAGVFDMLHVNHVLALTHYRLLGATRHQPNYDNLKTIQDIAASNRVKLVVSVDSDKRAKKDKEFVVSKGNCRKPIISWDNRTLILLYQSMFSADEKTAVPLVDYVTKHGQDTCSNKSCAHNDNVSIAEAIRPDIIVVSSGSPITIALIKASEILKDKELIVINEEELFYYDSLLSGPIKSSAIIKRVRQ